MLQVEKHREKYFHTEKYYKGEKLQGDLSQGEMVFPPHIQRINNYGSTK